MRSVMRVSILLYRPISLTAFGRLMMLCPLLVPVRLCSLFELSVSVAYALFSLHYVFLVFYIVSFVSSIFYYFINSCHVGHKEIPRTRADRLCPVFNVPETFKDHLIPTNADALFLRAIRTFKRKLRGTWFGWCVFAINKTSQTFMGKKIQFLL